MLRFFKISVENIIEPFHFKGCFHENIFVTKRLRAHARRAI